ncbi:MAG: energy transducer TonB [Caulobacterales bacterium]
MSVTGYREHDNRVPALLAAAALHAGLLALVIFLPSRPAMLPIGSSVPINIVSSDQVTDSRPAIQAPETQTAAAETPTPQAPPQPPAAQPAPPAFSNAPKPKLIHDKPAPQQPSLHAAPPQAQKSLDFNHLQQIIASAQRAGGSPTSGAQRGPARPETAPRARPNAGKGLSQSDQLGLQQLLERLWNPNCDVPGGADLKLQVKFTVGLNGNLIGNPSAGGAERSGDAVVAAATRRALDAVRQAEPYAEPYYGQPIVVNFDSKEACAKR